MTNYKVENGRRKRKYPSLIPHESREFLFMDTDPDMLTIYGEPDANGYVPLNKEDYRKSPGYERNKELLARNERRAREYEDEQDIPDYKRLYSGEAESTESVIFSSKTPGPHINHPIIYHICKQCGTEIVSKRLTNCPKCKQALD